MTWRCACVLQLQSLQKFTSSVVLSQRLPRVSPRQTRHMLSGMRRQIRQGWDRQEIAGCAGHDADGSSSARVVVRQGRRGGAERVRGERGGLWRRRRRVWPPRAPCSVASAWPRRRRGSGRDPGSCWSAATGRGGRRWWLSCLWASRTPRTCRRAPSPAPAQLHVGSGGRGQSAMRVHSPGNVPSDIHSRCIERHRRLCDCDESQALAPQALPVIVVNLGIANAVSFV